MVSPENKIALDHELTSLAGKKKVFLWCSIIQVHLCKRAWSWSLMMCCLVTVHHTTFIFTVRVTFCNYNKLVIRPCADSFKDYWAAVCDNEDLLPQSHFLTLACFFFINSNKILSAPLFIAVQLQMYKITWW